MVFSETVRNASWTRNGEFKLLRMSEQQRLKFAPRVLDLMVSKLKRNYRGMMELCNYRSASSVTVLNHNSVDGMPEFLGSDSIDIVVTSPPYGDSRTTVAYGQFSRLANQWLDHGEASRVDQMLMGGKLFNNGIQFASEAILRSTELIRQKDPKRSDEVKSFYSDYQKPIFNVSSVIRHGGFACYVVGNRRVKDETLPTDKITQELFESVGFKHIETFIRNIPNKRMPSRNSPSNVVGSTAETMSKEYIVVMQKV